MDGGRGDLLESTGNMLPFLLHYHKQILLFDYTSKDGRALLLTAAAAATTW